MMTDPIADMLTRIRNAVRVERPHVTMPLSKVKRGLAEVLKREGYIWGWQETDGAPVSELRIELKYGPNGERVIRHIRRVSKPGRRVYRRADVERFAIAICGRDTNAALLEQARIIAANEFVLRAINAQKIGVVERLRDHTAIALAKGDNSYDLATARFMQAWLAHREIESLVPKVWKKSVVASPRWSNAHASGAIVPGNPNSCYGSCEFSEFSLGNPAS